ncbi:hypothetical protein SCH4B_1637 [Ruegeria sp. TrichCH4B]|nr:hypothetical protein SCH4B_1637 [Ruegeria sp. TrichCH4B]
MSRASGKRGRVFKSCRIRSARTRPERGRCAAVLASYASINWVRF